METAETSNSSFEGSYGADYRLMNELLAGLRVERESRLGHNLISGNQEIASHPASIIIVEDSLRCTEACDNGESESGEISPACADKVRHEQSAATSNANVLKIKNQDQTYGSSTVAHFSILEDDTLLDCHEQKKMEMRIETADEACCNEMPPAVSQASVGRSGQSVMYGTSAEFKGVIDPRYRQHIESAVTSCDSRLDGDNSAKNQTNNTSIGFKRSLSEVSSSDRNTSESPCKRCSTFGFEDHGPMPSLSHPKLKSCSRGTKRLSHEISTSDIGIGLDKGISDLVESSPFKRRPPDVVVAVAIDNEDQENPPSPPGVGAAA
jgi:hypothetical protein